MLDNVIDTENQVFKPKQIVDVTKENMCRACLSQNAEMQSLFLIETSSVTSLLDMFMTCTSLEISESDEYPKQICKDCIKELARAFDFRTKCHNSLKELHILANENTDFKKVINIEVDVSIVKSEPEDSCDATEVFHYVPVTANKLEQTYPKAEKIQDPLIDKQQVPLSTSIMQEQIKSKRRKPKNALLKCYTCLICDEKFDELNILRQHKLQHKIVKRCSDCSMQFINVDAYKEHVTTHSYLCHDCGRIFHGHAIFQGHRTSHSEERPYQCNVCGKKYKTASSLNVHKRNHTGEKLYSCEECGKKFITWNSKYMHVRFHHTETRAHVCSICNKAYKQVSALTCHMRLHTGERPYQCSECPKTFTSSHSKVMHMKIHTGEKNIVCPLCDKRFIKKYDLKQHMVTHTGERKHSCKVCGKAFTQAHVLRSHMRTHGESCTQKS